MQLEVDREKSAQGVSGRVCVLSGLNDFFFFKVIEAL
jgi:hypothetical protein